MLNRRALDLPPSPAGFPACLPQSSRAAAAFGWMPELSQYLTDRDRHTRERLNRRGTPRALPFD
jgi:hypothetical protein